MEIVAEEGKARNKVLKSVQKHGQHLRTTSETRDESHGRGEIALGDGTTKN